MIISVTSAAADGATTTAVGMALTWPRACWLVEADPAGGSAVLAGYLGGRHVHDRSVVDACVAASHGQLSVLLSELVLPLVPGGDPPRMLMPGLRAHRQARLLDGVWPELLDELRLRGRAGTDTIIDTGRLGMDGYPVQALHGSDLVVVCARTTLPALARLSSWAAGVSDVLGATTRSRVRVLPVGPGRPFSPGEVTRATGLPTLPGVPWSPETAEVYSAGRAVPSRKLERAPLTHAYGTAGEAVRATAEKLHADIEGAAR
ncbi:MAG: hypothetical protein Q4G45_12425 [Actinomycetia bacterium]|nr:hypothetical protein [Actinomycetes bacterium]